jgi:hypothetical protein
MLGVAMLSVVMLNVVMLSVVAPQFIPVPMRKIMVGLYWTPSSIETSHFPRLNRCPSITISMSKVWPTDDYQGPIIYNNLLGATTLSIKTCSIMTQHFDIQHSNKYNVTLSIMTISIMAKHCYV